MSSELTQTPSDSERRTASRVPARLAAPARHLPLLTSAVVLAVLAVARIGGAFSETLVVVAIALTPIALVFLPPERRTAAGLCRPAGRLRLAAGVAIVLGSYLVVMLGCWIAFRGGEHDWLGLIRPMFDEMSGGSATVSLVYAILAMGLAVPLAEELVYRGMLLDGLGRIGVWPAIVTVSAVWAVSHLGDYGLRPFDPIMIAVMLPSVALMGLALGACRVITGSAVACVVAQGVGNLVLVAWAYAVL